MSIKRTYLEKNNFTFFTAMPIGKNQPLLEKGAVAKIPHSIPVMPIEISADHFDNRKNIYRWILKKYKAYNFEKLCYDVKGAKIRDQTRMHVIIKDLFAGYSVGEIAEKRSVSPHTINYYISRIYQECGVEDRKQLIIKYAIK